MDGNLRLERPILQIPSLLSSFQSSGGLLTNKDQKHQLTIPLTCGPDLQTFKALIDRGASSNFIDLDFCQQQNIKMTS